MGSSQEALRGLSMLGQLSLLLLIPILVGVFGGIWIDEKLAWFPICTILGSIVGIAAAFRNLYVWSVRQIARNQKSERVQQAMRESGRKRTEAQEEDTGDGAK